MGKVDSKFHGVWMRKGSLLFVVQRIKIHATFREPGERSLNVHRASNSVHLRVLQMVILWKAMPWTWAIFGPFANVRYMHPACEILHEVFAFVGWPESTCGRLCRIHD